MPKIIDLYKDNVFSTFVYKPELVGDEDTGQSHIEKYFKPRTRDEEMLLMNNTNSNSSSRNTNSNSNNTNIKVSLDQDQRAAIRSVVTKRQNVFITGQAGTGKTFVIRCIVKLLGSKRVALCSSTGVSAVSIHGCTFHSLFSLYPGIEHEDPVKLATTILRKKSSTQRSAIRNLDCVIIDEVSMIPGYLLEFIDILLRNVRVQSKHIPFGNVQIVSFGDFGQLSPVVKKNFKPECQFAFQAECWMSFTMCRLTIQHRQSDDLPFANLLNRARHGELSDDDIALLKTRLVGSATCIDESPDIEPTYLFSYNNDVDKYNNKKLAELIDDQKSFSASTILIERCQDEKRKRDAPEWMSLEEGVFATKVGKTIKRSVRPPDVLDLKIGAQVMLVQNKTWMGLANGSRGVVIGWDEMYPSVKFASGLITTITTHAWEFDQKTLNCGIRPVRGTFTQLPLVLAWAFSIHKAQGLTIDKLRLSITKREMFQPNMGYTALSRCPCLSGLFLDAIERDAVYVDPRVVEYL